jgi:hypothetical protein
MNRRNRIVMAKTLYEKIERGCRGKRADCSPSHEGAFVELLNKEMEELLKNIENNEELKKLYENNSINSKGVENEK